MHEDGSVHPIQAALRRQWPRMTQTRLAKELGISETLLSKYVRRVAQPPEGFFIAAAAILGCTPDELKPEEGVAA
jgi:transcriptional regulator with XRE-family HTH domain